MVGWFSDLYPHLYVSIVSLPPISLFQANCGDLWQRQHSFAQQIKLMTERGFIDVPQNNDAD